MDELTDLDLKKLEEMLAKSESICHLPNYRSHLLQRREGWNDEKLEEIANELNFDRGVYDRANHFQILNRFYNFYFNGIVSDGDNAAAIVTEAVAIAVVNGIPIFKDLPIDGKSYTKNKSQNELFDNPTKIEYSGLGLSAHYLPKNYEKTNGAIAELMTQINWNHAPSDVENKLKSLTGYLALTLHRFAIKDENQMKKIFKYREYRDELCAAIGWNIDNIFSPPCDTCMKECSYALRKERSNTILVFAKTVQCYINSMKNAQMIPIREYLWKSLLNSTELNGLALIRMVNQICDRFNIKWSELKEYTDFEQTKKAWEAISPIFLKYLNEDDIQYSFRWARIIDDRYLCGLSPKDHIEFSYILQGCIAEFQGESVWNAAWCKNRIMRSGLVSNGKTIYILLSEKNQNKK